MQNQKAKAGHRFPVTRDFAKKRKKRMLWSRKKQCQAAGTKAAFAKIVAIG